MAVTFQNVSRNWTENYLEYMCRNYFGIILVMKVKENCDNLLWSHWRWTHVSDTIYIQEIKLMHWCLFEFRKGDTKYVKSGFLNCGLSK